MKQFAIRTLILFMRNCALRHCLSMLVRYLEELIAAEVAAGIPSDRVVVAGFSQGGAIALMMLRSSMKLGAVVGLSTYLPLRDQEPVSEANRGTPVLLCHGDKDQVVAYEFGRSSDAVLRNLGMSTEFNTYQGMGHSACQAELKDFKEFVIKHLK